MSQPGDRLALAEVAEELLGHLEDYWAGVPEAEQLPERRVVAAGLSLNLAWDCQSVLITCDVIERGQAEDALASPVTPQMPGQVSTASTRYAALAVQIVRCAPVPTTSGRSTSPPTPEKIHEAGILHLKDQGRLSQALVHIAGRPWSSLSAGSLAASGRVESLGPEGDYQAVVGALQVTLADLAP